MKHLKKLLDVNDQETDTKSEEGKEKQTPYFLSTRGGNGNGRE